MQIERNTLAAPELLGATRNQTAYTIRPPLILDEIEEICKQKSLEEAFLPAAITAGASAGAQAQRRPE